MENTKATTAEAELALHLYDLRRETEMRKARNWFSGEFWPKSYSDVEQIASNYGSPQSHWFGQVTSYWEIAASLVVRGALPQGLFLDTCGEAWFVYAKLKPYLQEARAKFSPEVMANLEKVIEGTTEGRERLKRMQEMIAGFASKMQEGRKAAGGKEAAA